MSAERRLMVHTQLCDNNMSECESESIDIVKRKMKNIIDIAVVGEG